MSTTATVTEAAPAPSPVLKLNSSAVNEQTSSSPATQPYRYSHLLPHFSQDHYPPLEPFEHVDPGHRALAREREAIANETIAEGSTPLPSFLRSPNVTLSEITPNLGVEVSGVSLSQLDDAARDDLALLVARRGLVIFRNQQEFIDSSPEAYKEWGRYFGRLHIHPTSGHPEGHPEIHLVYRDENTTFNFEREDRSVLLLCNNLSILIAPSAASRRSPGTATSPTSSSLQDLLPFSFWHSRAQGVILSSRAKCPRSRS